MFTPSAFEDHLERRLDRVGKCTRAELKAGAAACPNARMKRFTADEGLGFEHPAKRNSNGSMSKKLRPSGFSLIGRILGRNCEVRMTLRSDVQWGCLIESNTVNMSHSVSLEVEWSENKLLERMQAS